MKIPERTGKWIEMEGSKSKNGEIIISVPNSIWAGWQTPIFVQEEDVAAFLRSLGWQVALPNSVGRGV
jgi:hypothetical protein